MLFSVSQNDGTDFLKNAITYGQTEGFTNELWRGDDVSIVFFFFFKDIAQCKQGNLGDDPYLSSLKCM